MKLNKIFPKRSCFQTAEKIGHDLKGKLRQDVLSVSSGPDIFDIGYVGNKVIFGNKSLTRIPYGKEANFAPCPECGSERGSLHKPGCMHEMCPSCKGAGICAETNDEHTQIMTQLATHGFHIHLNDSGAIKFILPSGLGGLLMSLEHGKLMSVVMHPRKDLREVTPKILHEINKLNFNATVTRFFIDDRKWVVAQSLYQGIYDSLTFSNFLISWKVDFAGIKSLDDELNSSSGGY